MPLGENMSDAVCIQCIYEPHSRHEGLGSTQGSGKLCVGEHAL